MACGRTTSGFDAGRPRNDQAERREREILRRRQAEAPMGEVAAEEVDGEPADRVARDRERESEPGSPGSDSASRPRDQEQEEEGDPGRGLVELRRMDRE